MRTRSAGVILLLAGVLVGGALVTRTNSQQVPVAWNPEWAEILSHMSVEYLDDGNGGQVKTIRFTGVDVQIVNGLGQTGAVNGTGNLVVGYNELGNPIGDFRTGSHNIVVGDGNNHDAGGALITGLYNSSYHNFTALVGGQANSVRNAGAVICGGSGNVVESKGHNGVVVGGSGNVTNGGSSVIIAGSDNYVEGGQIAIIGGSRNETRSPGAHNVIVGGLRNEIAVDTSFAVVSGGEENMAAGDRSVVSGGFQRSATGEHDWVAGSLFEDN